jgi:predicted dehydrogenase
MSTTRNIGVGVIGLGFIGQTHARAYKSAADDGLPCRLVAICDSDERKLEGEAATGNIAMSREREPNALHAEARRYRDPVELIVDADVDLVSICTYTDTHVDLAIAALRAGKHVLVEKPVAVRSSDVRRLADIASGSTSLCMPAMCMRFWPGWDWLHDRIQGGDFGAGRAASFQRLGSAPAWGSNFYSDATRSGGAMVDLHIHDADFVYWCFGRPRSVEVTGTADHFTTVYRFDGGPEYVAAEGGWSLSPGPGSPFRMRFMIVFDRAVVDYELGRHPPLLLRRDGRVESIEIAASTGYDGEVRHMVQCIASGRRDLRATLHDAVAVSKLLELESESLALGHAVDVAARD